MKFFHRNWYNISFVIGLGVITILSIYWNKFSILQRFAIANLAVLFFHFYEEFGFPGGFGKLANTLLTKNSPAIDRFPLNQTSVWFGNWTFALLFYVPPIFFPNQIWLGLMPMLFGAVGQMFSHGILNNVMLKRAGLRYGYNSGLATAIFGHVPLCIGYGYYIESYDLTTGWDWIIGFLYAIFAYIVVFRMMIMKVFEDKNTRYPFDETETSRFDRLYGQKEFKNK